MKPSFPWQVICVLILVCFCSTASVMAEDVPEPANLASATSAFPDELRDPAFENFVSLEYAREALCKLDPGKIADVALQLAEAERVLVREHSAIRSESLIKVAIRTAIDEQDVATLDRLARYAKSSENEALAAEIDVSKKLASAARKLKLGPNVPAGETTPEGIVLYNAFYDEVRRAAAFRNIDQLMLIQASLSELTELHPLQRRHLAQMISKVMASATRGKSGQAKALTKLAGRSRLIEQIDQPQAGPAAE